MRWRRVSLVAVVSLSLGTSCIGESNPKHIHITRSITIETPEPVQPLALAQLKDGGYLVAGQQLKLESAWAMRTNSENHILWMVTLAKERDQKHPTQFVAVLARADGSALLFGYDSGVDSEAFSVEVDARGTSGPAHPLGNPDRVDPTWTPPSGVNSIIIPVHIGAYLPSGVWNIGMTNESAPAVVFPLRDRPIGVGSELLINERASVKSEQTLVDTGAGGRVEGTRLSWRDATGTRMNSQEVPGNATLFQPVDNSSKVYALLEQRHQLELGEFALSGSYRTLTHGLNRSTPFGTFRSYRLSNGSLVEFGYAGDEPEHFASIRRFSADLSSIEQLKSGRENHSGTYGEVIPTGRPNEFIGAYPLLVVSPPAPANRFGIVLDFVQVD